MSTDSRLIRCVWVRPDALKRNSSASLRHPASEWWFRAVHGGTVPDVNEWLDPDGVCEMIGIGRTALYALWRDGRGPRYSQVGRRRLVREDWLEDWLLECEVCA